MKRKTIDGPEEYESLNTTGVVSILNSMILDGSIRLIYTLEFTAPGVAGPAPQDGWIFINDDEQVFMGEPVYAQTPATRLGFTDASDLGLVCDEIVSKYTAVPEPSWNIVRPAGTYQVKFYHVSKTPVTYPYVWLAASFYTGIPGTGIPDDNWTLTRNTSTAEQYDGAWEDVSLYASVSVLVIIDTASGESGTLTMELSVDSAGTNKRSKSVLVSFGTSSVHTLSIVSKYFRVYFTPGTACHGAIQTIFHKYRTQGLMSFIGESINDQNDAQLVRSVLTAKNTAGNYVNVTSDLSGGLKISDGITGIYGEKISLEYTPYVQTSHFYGIDTHSQLHTVFSAGGGAIAPSTDGNAVTLSIGTGVGDYYVLRDKRVIKYRHGYGNLIRLGYTFDGNAVANSLQFCGAGNAVSDLYFCYTGTSFGVRVSTGGLLHVYKVVVTTSATGGTVDITLNSVLFTITLTNAGGDTSFTAHEIEIGGSGSVAYTGWNVEHIGSDMYFIASDVGVRSGTYSVVNNTEAAMATTLSTPKTGAALTSDFVAQASWNGLSPLVTSLDPTLGNLYEISYTWFGTANIEFKVYNSATGRFEIVHTYTYANVGTVYSLSAANLYIQRGVASLGSTTALSCDSSGSFGGTVGHYNLNKAPKGSASTTKTLTANTETALMVIGNRKQINGFSNQAEVLLRNVSITSDGNRAVIIKIVKNATLAPTYTTTDYTAYSYFNEDDSLFIYDTTVDTWSGGRILEQTVIPKDGGVVLDTSQVEMYMGPDETITISAISTATNIVNVSVTVISDN